MARYFSSRLSEKRYEQLFLQTEEAFKQQFFVYEIGPLCNATRPCAFSTAICDLNAVPEGDVSGTAVKSIDFPLLYKKGFDLLKDTFKGSVNFEDFDEPYKRALQTLLDFLLNTEINENCLAKALPQKKEDASFNETDISVAISIHLLTKLSAGKSFIIDNHSKNKKGCRCGCQQYEEIRYSGTGFGDEHVWHGYFDVVLSAHGEPESGLHAVKRPRLDLGEESEDKDEAESVEEDELGSSPGGKNGVEVKKDFRDVSVENQSAAQAMVFSITQKERHKNLNNFLIPFLTVSASHVRIFMYDAEKDILLRSEQLPIFTEDKSFQLSTVITLWMVLHYKHFCTGIDAEDLKDRSLRSYKSGFLDYIQPCIKYYKASKSCFGGSFPSVPEERKLLGEKPRNYVPQGYPRPQFCSEYVYFKNGKDESSDSNVLSEQVLSGSTEY